MCTNRSYKASLALMIFATVIVFIGCDKSEQHAKDFASRIATSVVDVKSSDEFFHPDKKYAMDMLKNNPEKVLLEDIEIIEIGKGSITIAVKGKSATVQYQNQEDYQKEFKKKIAIITQGPVIKNFYLGMSADSVMSVINSSFPVKDRSKYTREENVIYFKSGLKLPYPLMFINADLISIITKESSYFMFDKNNKLEEFCIGTTDIDHLFNTGTMSLDKFVQNFVNGYSFIDTMKPYYNTDKKDISAGFGLTMPLRTIFKGYNYESDYGWELRILDTPIVSLENATLADSHKNIAGAIYLKKTKSKNETQFGD